MKTVAMEKTNLDSCVKKAKSGRVLLTRNGDPVAILVGVDGLDKEQVQLGTSDKFWKLITGRRKQKSVSREILEQRISKQGKTGQKERG